MQQKGSLVIIAVLTTIVVLQSTSTVGALSPGSVERSWMQTFVVRPMDSIALRGALGITNTQVNGSLTVRSCCGYSTNDIKFSIHNVDFSASQDFSVIVGSLSFGWNTGTSEEYVMNFDNGWGQVCRDLVCSPDPSHPSSHNKTIELSVRETAASSFSSLLTPANLIIGVGSVVGVGLALSGLVILREKRKRRQPDAKS